MLARKHGLMPKTEEDTVRVELAEEQLRDTFMATAFVAYGIEGWGMNEESRRQAIPNELIQLEKFLGNRNFIAGNYVTFVDFILYDSLTVQQKYLPSALDGRDALKKYMERFENLNKGLKNYLASDVHNSSKIFTPIAKWQG